MNPPRRLLAPSLATLAALATSGCQVGDYDGFGGQGEGDGDRLGPGVGGGGSGDDDDAAADDDATPSGPTLTAEASLDELSATVVDTLTYARAEVTVQVTATGLDQAVTIDDPLSLDLYRADDMSLALSALLYNNLTWTIGTDGTSSQSYQTDPALTSNEWYDVCGVELYGIVTVTWGTLYAALATTNAAPMTCSIQQPG